MEASNLAATSDVPVFTEGNTRIVDGKESAFEIPCVLLNLAKSKVHIPLTLLTLSSLHKIHEDSACVKMKKGLVMNDPKLFVMDPSSSFPLESSLQPHSFYEAASNFIKLLSQVADDATVQRFTDHHDFCLSRDEFSDNFESVLAFDDEIHRRFFNTHTFPSRAAYLDRWKNMLIKKPSHSKAQTITITNLTCLISQKARIQPVHQVMENPFGGAKVTNRPSTSFASFVEDSDTRPVAAHTHTHHKKQPHC
jgi:hypothetical protein